MVNAAAQPATASIRPEPLTARITIGAAREHAVDARLFGQFLERASFGEPGPEGALDPATGDLREDVVEIARGMRIPLMRFPGGTDVDYTDWRDLVDGAAAPGPRASMLTGHTGKTIGTRYGIDEYFTLRDRLGCQTILVVNLLDALARRCPLAEAAHRAAGLVAYANAAVGATLPEGMPDWPALRAANGRPEPFRAEFIQLGNEWWCGGFPKAVVAANGALTPPEMAEWYRKCLHAFIAAIRAVDPDIGIIIDGDPGPQVDLGLYEDELLRAEIAFLALHTYGPGPVDRVTRAGEVVAAERLAADDWWWAWVGALGARDADGRGQGIGAAADRLTALGYRIACTEWNWNGFGFHRLPTHPGEHRMAAALGTAAFLNGLMRHGADVRLATQSMLIGTTWTISAILVTDETCEPRRTPSGQVTALYSRCHGGSRLEARVVGSPVVDHPYAVGWRQSVRIAVIDAVATEDDGHLYLHLVNNDPHRAAALQVEIPAGARLSGTATVRRLVASAEPGDPVIELEERIAVTASPMALLVPAASVSIIVFARQSAA